MANVELTWTAPGKSHADVTLGYDPASVDANGNAIATTATGTYQVLDANGTVIRTDNITGLIPANSYALGPDDQVNIAGQNPVVSSLGIGFSIDNAADADDILGGFQNVPGTGTPQVVLGSEILGGYYELDKTENATDVTVQPIGSSPPAGGGGSGGGSPGSGAGGTTSSGGVSVTQGANGHFHVDITAPGQTVTSDFFDTFQNNGSPATTFVFNAPFGLDVVKLFRPDNEDHDTLSFSRSDFNNSIAQVLHDSHNQKGGVLITDPVSGDEVKLAGVSKKELAHYAQQDITFHP